MRDLRPAASPIALLVMRAAVGAIFIAHGSQKIFEVGLNGVRSQFESIGVPWAAIAAPVISSLELAGGVLLVLGLGARIIAALLAATMVVAIVAVHGANGFFVSGGGFEFVFLLGVVCVVIVIAGPGVMSLDRLASQNRRLRHPSLRSSSPSAG